MHIFHTIAEVRAWRREQESVAFVPTMGNLHEGHLKLVEAAKQRAVRVIVSIFVNRLQFGQGEDFNSYPRTFDDDCQKLIAAGRMLYFSRMSKSYTLALNKISMLSHRMFKMNYAARSVRVISVAWRQWCVSCLTLCNLMSRVLVKKTTNSSISSAPCVPT